MKDGKWVSFSEGLKVLYFTYVFQCKLACLYAHFRRTNVLGHLGEFFPCEAVNSLGKLSDFFRFYRKSPCLFMTAEFRQHIRHGGKQLEHGKALNATAASSGIFPLVGDDDNGLIEFIQQL